MGRASIGYINKDYESIRQELLAKIPQLTDRWTDFNHSDLGVVLLDLFCGVGDMLVYYLDAQAAEAFLPTARQRQNVINLCKLIGYRSADEVLGREIREFLDEGSRMFFSLLQHRVFRGEAIPTRFETRMIRQGGSTIDVETSFAMIWYKGAPALNLTVGDITGIAKKGKELKRDIESAILIRALATAGVAGSARISAGMQTYMETSLTLNSHITSATVTLTAWSASHHTPKERGQKKTLSLTGFKKLMQTYVGITAASPSQPKVFACPADTVHYNVSRGRLVLRTEPLHNQSFVDYLSYGFNGGNLNTKYNRLGIDVSQLGIAGRTISSIRNPVRTVLVAELPAFDPFSWHQPKRPLSVQNSQFKDSRNMVSFVDGHVSYIRMFWTDTSGTNRARLAAAFYNPPPDYDYQWGGD